MHKMIPHQELDAYKCLLCDEQFFNAPEQKLVCPQCGNEDQEQFAAAEEENGETQGSAHTTMSFSP